MRVNTELLKREMERNNLNIISLSEKSDVDKATISRLLNEKTSCSVFTAQKIALALNLSPVKAGKIFFADDVA